MKNIFPSIDDKAYWNKVEKVAKDLKSDGCTGVPDFYIRCCWEHDISYRTGKTVFGYKMTRAKTDRRFRQCIQQSSPFGIFSPMAIWRWAGVRLFGRKLWKGEK